MKRSNHYFHTIDNYWVMIPIESIRRSRYLTRLIQGSKIPFRHSLPMTMKDAEIAGVMLSHLVRPYDQESQIKLDKFDSFDHLCRFLECNIQPRHDGIVMLMIYYLIKAKIKAQNETIDIPIGRK